MTFLNKQTSFHTSILVDIMFLFLDNQKLNDLTTSSFENKTYSLCCKDLLMAVIDYHSFSISIDRLFLISYDKGDECISYDHSWLACSSIHVLMLYFKTDFQGTAISSHLISFTLHYIQIYVNCLKHHT